MDTNQKILSESCIWCAEKLNVRSSHPEVFCKKGVLKNFAKFTGLACNFIKKETLTQVLSCEFCEISENTFFTEHIQMTASFLHGECLLWNARKLKRFDEITRIIYKTAHEI